MTTIQPTGTQNDSPLIQAAIDNLTDGILILDGNFLLQSTIKPKNNMTLQINGSIKMNGANNFDLINIINQHDITIQGPSTTVYGEIIGDATKPLGTAPIICGSTLQQGWGIRTCGSQKQNYAIVFKNLAARNCAQSGIALNQVKYGGIVYNCICNNNGQNGIGFGDDNGIIVSNCHCEGNRDSGIQFEDVISFKSQNNVCNKNHRHNCQVQYGESGQILGGTYNECIGDVDKGDGIDIRDHGVNISKNIMIDGITSSGNKLDGVLIDFGSTGVTVQNSICNSNGNYGVFEKSGDYNLIKDNTLYYNVQKAGFRITGSNSKASGNKIGDCIPNWMCETPLNGYENDGCGNRRANSLCNPITEKWKCSGSPDYTCNLALDGTYDTEQLCKDACKATTLKWKCSGSPDYICTQASDGTYDTEQLCKDACKAGVVDNTTLIIVLLVIVLGLILAFMYYNK